MENKIEAVVRENVDTALEQADEFLKQASAATGEEAKELQAKAKECLDRSCRRPPARSPGCSQVILPEAFGDKYVR